MRHLDEGTIHRWLDGAADADEVRRIEAHLAECPSCASAVAEARGLIAASSRILSALDVVPADVIPAAHTVARADGAPAAPDGDMRVSAARRGSGAMGGTRSRWLPRAARIAAVVTVLAVGARAATRIIGDRSTRHTRLAARDASQPVASSPAARSGVQTAQVASADSAATRPAPTTPPSLGKSNAQRRPPSAATKIAAVPSRPERAKSTPVVADAGRAADAQSGSRGDSGSGVEERSRRDVASAKPAEPAPTANTIAGATARSDSVNEARTRAPAARVSGAPSVKRPPLGVQLRLVSADRVVTPDARVVQRRIYEVRPGVRVTLEEAAAPADHLAPVDEGAHGRTLAPTAQPALEKQSERAVSADSAGLNSIRWTDSTGTQFTLTGRLTIEELRRLKALVH